jgi:hypothetical protein
VVSVLLVVWLARTPRNDWRTALPLALILGGAVGNLIDRMRFGHVVDFIDVHYGSWSFPAFNVADSGVSVGAVLLIAFSFFTARAGTRQNDGMQVVLANPRGFCAGVDRAIEIVEARAGNLRRADLCAPRSRAQPLRGGFDLRAARRGFRR